jgi:hypothetical protein
VQAKESGLRYAWQIPGKRPLNILQTIGNGCAFLDFDNDNHLDILLIGPRLALFKGDGRGRFTDVTRAMSLDQLSGHFLGVAVGDVDGDGFDDLYVSGYNAGLLLHNDRGRRFQDITLRSGLKPTPWGTSCAFAEISPGSGKLDLYVANYAVFDPRRDPQFCNTQGVMTSCPPRNYKPLIGNLYGNDGRGRFTDITRMSGATTTHGRALGVAFGDYLGNGRPGLAIANDELPGDLLEPIGSANPRSFKNVGDISGTAFDRDARVHGGMGLDWGDYDDDGRLDLFVATYQDELKCLYHNEGIGQFSDQGVPSGVSGPAARYVAFGCKFFDYDNDGRLDLIIANGHVQDNISAISKTNCYRQATQLFHNAGSKPPTFLDVSNTSGPDIQRLIVGRGLAIGDYDNDGKMDLLVVDSEGEPLLLHNQSPAAGHWLGITLIGTKSNRDGYGARVIVKAGGRVLHRDCQSCGSYLSASDKRVHFGLGTSATIETLTIKWSSGATSTFHNVRGDHYVTIREGEKTVR